MADEMLDIVKTTTAWCYCISVWLGQWCQGGALWNLRSDPVFKQSMKPPTGGFLISGAKMAATAAHFNPVTTIVLTGLLRQKFGRTHRRQLDSGRSWEALKALCCTLRGFKEEVRRLARLGMRFAVFRNGHNIGVDSLELGGTRDLKIAPVLQGGKRAGILQTVLGAVLLVASIWFPSLAPAGIALVAGGVIQMLSPQASGLRQSASPENLPSYAFGSAKNTTASGNPVPICIGRRRWGGAIISASIYAEDKA